MYEKIKIGNKTLTVREVSRQVSCQRRVLEAKDGRLFLEYLESTGPYKIDVPTVIELSPEQVRMYKDNLLDVCGVKTN